MSAALCVRCERAPRYGKNRYCLPCMKLVEDERNGVGGDQLHQRLLAESKAATGKTFAWIDSGAVSWRGAAREESGWRRLPTFMDNSKNVYLDVLTEALVKLDRRVRAIEEHPALSIPPLDRRPDADATFSRTVPPELPEILSIPGICIVSTGNMTIEQAKLIIRHLLAREKSDV